MHTPVPYSTNCFTVGRFGEPTVGIKVAVGGRLMVGNRYLPIDRLRPAVIDDDGLIKLAGLNFVKPITGRPGFCTLVAPDEARPKTSLVRLCLAHPMKNLIIKIKDVPVKLYMGTTGGRVIEQSADEVLVELGEVEELVIFYEDGGVRRFRRQGQLLEGQQLSTEEMLEARIVEAKHLVETEWHRPRAEHFLKAVILGMVDLVRFTARYNQRGTGQELRLRILKGFFLALPQLRRTPAWEELFQVVNEVDPPLRYLLRSVPEVERPLAPVTNIADRRAGVAALSPVDRSTRHAAHLAAVEAARVAKEARKAASKDARRLKAAQAPKGSKKDRRSHGERKAA